MQLQAVILPPDEVVEGALAAGKDVMVAPPAVEGPPPGLMSRMFKRAAATPPSPALEVMPVVSPALRVVRFGNVTNEDAHGLADALESAAREWPAPMLHVSGMQVEQSGTQFLLDAVLGGETELAWSIFRGVLDVGKNQRFFLDRRSFQPQLSVASLSIDGEPNPSVFETTPEFLLGSAETYAGPEWRATHLQLVRVPFAAGAALEVIAELALASVE